MTASKSLTAKAASRALRALADPAKAQILQRFFKTGPGQYGEGDVFLGVVMPRIREVARRFEGLPLEEACQLVHSKVHEERMLGLVVLVLQYRRADDTLREKIFSAYLRNLDGVNNWDLVDVTVPHVVGAHLYRRDRKLLYTLARSKRMWDRRVAILATFHFIQKGDFADTLELASRFLEDPHDLMHKAVGWMLREVGKRDTRALEAFLDVHGDRMPRTMLRYAIERFPEKKRLGYLNRTKAGAPARKKKSAPVSRSRPGLRVP